jgi:predicted CopG family antitoxin
VVQGIDVLTPYVHDQCMAVKTITIDLEAYALLARQKREGQSFSQVVKEHFGPQPTAGRFLARLRGVRPSEAGLDAMDKVVRRRRRDAARATVR